MIPPTASVPSTSLLPVPGRSSGAGGRRLRLAPVPRVTSWRVRLFAWFFRTQLGMVMTPIWVIYARMPRLLWPQVLMLRLAQRGLSLDATLVNLLQTRVSIVNGCTFCSDLHRAVALREGESAAKFAALGTAEGREAFVPGAFTAGERAALAFADEVAASGESSAEAFAALRDAFDERQIVEIVWLCSFIGYLNRMAKGLGIGSDGFCEAAGSREL